MIFWLPCLPPNFKKKQFELRKMCFFWTKKKQGNASNGLGHNARFKVHQTKSHKSAIPVFLTCVLPMSHFFDVPREWMFLAIRNRVWMDGSTVLYKQRKEPDCCCLCRKPKCVLHRHYSFLRLHFQPTFFEGQNHDKWLGTVVSVSPNYRGKKRPIVGRDPAYLGVLPAQSG